MASQDGLAKTVAILLQRSRTAISINLNLNSMEDKVVEDRAEEMAQIAMLILKIKSLLMKLRKRLTLKILKRLYQLKKSQQAVL